MGSSPGSKPRPQHSSAYRRLVKALIHMREIDAGITQRELATRLREPQSFVAKSETGNRRIDPIELIRWCRACGVDPVKVIKQLKP